ncbi:hypothetical protein Tco_1073609, partial [Tanacetum coccineum]
RVPIERLTPDKNEARSDWWVSSRAYFGGRINEAERVPRHVNRQNHYEVPLELYQEIKEQKRAMDEMLKRRLNGKKRRSKYIFSLLKCAQSTPSYGHNMAMQNWQTPMPSYPGTSNWQTQMPPRSATLNWQTPMHRILMMLAYSTWRTSYMDLPPTTVLPKKRGDKTNNKVKNANLSPLNLENAFADDNVRGDDVMFLGEHDIGNCLVYENVDPSKVRREDYIDCMKFLLNPYDVYLDCHMIGYMVPDYFWRQLVPHLCMPDSHSLERANQEGWLSDDDDRGRQLAIMNLAHEFNDTCITKDELRKAYEECRDIPLEQRALIDNYLKIESELDYEMHNALLWQVAKLEKQIIDKTSWIQQI